MFKIWAKIITKEKIEKQYMFFGDKFSANDFNSYLNDICYNLDIPSPIVVYSHIQNYLLFNNTSFKQSDFVEHIHFDKLVLENAS